MSHYKPPLLPPPPPLLLLLPCCTPSTAHSSVSLPHVLSPQPSSIPSHLSFLNPSAFPTSFHPLLSPSLSDCLCLRPIPSTQPQRTPDEEHPPGIPQTQTRLGLDRQTDTDPWWQGTSLELDRQAERQTETLTPGGRYSARVSIYFISRVLQSL